MAVAVYLRVSTEEQRERQSIATQREFAERYVQLHNLAVYRQYADDGVSGTIPLEQRPEGSQILADARRGNFDQLLIYRLDRLGRETRLILNAVAELEKLGVRVRSMTEEFDTASATGRLMLTMLSGFAAHEHAVIRERSLAGTNRVAEAGAWLGGIVPYGFRKIGEKAAARLAISDEPIPGMEMSEADVVRMIYQMAATERKSCLKIADHLNRLRVPPAYARDGRLIVRGKRKQRTSGLWTPGRVRNLIVSTTYMGRHEYGKRSPSKSRKVITRPVPAIVTENIWKKAQQTLKDNFLFCPRSARNQYLLRGLIKCGLCGRTFVGSVSRRPNGNSEFYYKCNGAHTPALYRPTGRCQSKAVRGDYLEQQVWSDVEAFLRNPEPVLEQLHACLESDAGDCDRIRKQVARLESLLAEKANERSRVLGLYRRGRLTDADLDAQMEEIGKEQVAIEAQIGGLRAKIAGADSITTTINSAQALLAKLRKRLDEPISWELKRRLIEVLVAGVRVDTVETCGVKQANITVTYRFSQPDQPMPVLLPQSYASGAVVRIPTEPRTIGDHIRRQRLGYNPLPEGRTWGERVVRHRTALGMTQKEAAGEIGVDPGTLARWERSEREPGGAFLTRGKRFVSGGQVAHAVECCAG